MPTLYPPDDDQREAHHLSAPVPWPAAWQVAKPHSARWHVSGGALRTADRSPLRAGTVVLLSLLGTRRVGLWNPIRASAPARVQFRVLHPVHPASMAEILEIELDRKSTRLNSSHTVISYAVFCLKKNRCRHPRFAGN